MDDLNLLAEYVATGSHAAFERVVGTHINLVYSAARRQLSDRHLAEDVTQAVFVVLARKAPSLIERQYPLAGWLLSATHYAARDAMKLAARRRRHERSAG